MDTPVLLHACCAPCSSAILEWLLQNGYHPTIFYCNPNIFPYAEYMIRKNELTRHACRLGLRVIDGDWDHTAWREAVKGLEAEPERGRRCLACFTLRLARTARTAHELGIPLFTTTLASSRWKDLSQVNEAGRRAAALYPDTRFWDKNWRKGGLQERRSALVRELGFYNQRWCGCEFSMGRLTDEEKREALSKTVPAEISCAWPLPRK